MVIIYARRADVVILDAKKSKSSISIQRCWRSRMNYMSRVASGDTAINKVHKMQKVASEISRGFNPSTAAPSKHNNFSRDFKPVNFLPRNHRPVSALPSSSFLTRYPLVRIARRVLVCFYANKNRVASCRIVWSRENQIPRSVIISHRL